jgi:hypothetical protein
MDMPLYAPVSAGSRIELRSHAPIRSGRARKVRSLSRRLREVGPGGWLLLFKTFCLLLAAKAALRWLPVKKIIGWKQRAVERQNEATEEELLRARHAVLVVARYSPVRFVCFPQCLAASALLRAKGIESRLHYGVARADDKLVTHTWLEAGGQIVIGGEVAADYSKLAVY